MPYLTLSMPCRFSRASGTVSWRRSEPPSDSSSLMFSTGSELCIDTCTDMCTDTCIDMCVDVSHFEQTIEGNCNH